MAYSLAQLQAYFKNANGGVDPTAAQNQILLSYVNQNSTNIITDAQALQSTVDLASDTTTAVSVETYQFFLGFAPSAAGLAALNKAYTGTGAQANLNGENRFIAQSVSLALQNATAKSGFAAAYGTLSYADAATQAYNVIVGSAAATAAGINVANAVAFLTSPASIAYYTAFVKANVPGIADADVNLAVKAAIVGEILYQATVFNNGAGVGSYATVTNNLVNDLADDGVLQADNAAGIDLFGSYGVKATPQNFVLTDKADVLTGASGDDVFVATNTTLSAADNLKGGSGNDALIYSSSGNVAVNQAGFTASGIETVQVTSDAVGGTTFDVSGTTGVAVLINDNSSSDLTLTGINAPTALVLRNTSTPTGATTNTTLVYTAAAAAGATTTQSVSLENVYNPTTGVTGAATSSITANGVEIFNVVGAGASASHIGTLASNTLTTVNITGAQGVTIDSLTFAANASGTLTGVVDGSKSTGGINVTVTNSGAADTTVTGGTGNDRADFSNGFDAKDSFDGGTGTDTLVLANGTATSPTIAGKVTSVEVLEVSGGGNGTVDLSKFAGVQSVVYTTPTGSLTGASLVNAVSLTNVTSTSTLTFDAGTVGQNVSLATGTATNTAADVTTININKVGAADAVGTITTTGIETVNVVVADDTTVPGTGALTIASIGNGGTAATKSVVISGNTDVTITGNVGASTLTNFDASGVTGKLSVGSVTTALSGATVKFGASDDVIRISATAGTATGGDTITLGAGKDSIVYTSLAQSGDKTTDTITDFKQGEDRLDLTGLVGTNGTGILANTQFVGNRASFGLAQGALTGGNGVPQAVFQADTSTLWVDLDGNGQLDANDFRVVLTGVTALTAADLGLALTGNTITLSAPAAVVSTTVNTNADAKTTADNDTINTSIANLNGSNINGGLGTADTIVLSTAGTVNVNNGTTGGTISNVEGLTLANGTNTITFTAGSGIKNVTGGTGNDTVTVTNMTAGGAIDLGAGADTLNAVTKAFVETTGASISGGGSGIGTVAGVDIDTINVAGGVTGTLDLTKVSNFEVVNVTLAGGTTIQGATAATDGLASGVATLATTGAAATIYTTVAKLDAITTSNAGTSNAYILTNAGSFTLVDTAFSGAHTIATSNTGNSTVTVDTNAKAGYLTGNGANDTLVIAGDFGTDTVAATSFETVNVTAAQTGTLTFLASNTTVNASAAGTYVLGGVATTFNGSGAGAQTVTGANFANTFNIASSAATTINGGTAVDTLALSGSGAVTFNGGAGADVATVTGTGALAFVGGAGIDTVTLNAGTATADSISFAGASTGITAAADRDVINNFVAANDTIVLDIDQTTATTLTASAAVLQVVGTAGAFTASNTADVTVLNFDQAGAVNVLAGVLDGAALLANTGTITVAAAQVGYLVAYDAGNAYLYSFTNNGDTTLAQGEIALIGTFNNVAVGALGGANFTTL